MYTELPRLHKNSISEDRKTGSREHLINMTRTKQYANVFKTVFAKIFNKSEILKKMRSTPLLYVQGMYACKWYKDAVDAKLSTEEFNKVADKNLKTLFTVLNIKGKALTTSNFLTYRRFSEYCAIQKHDMSLEDTGRVADFFKWYTKDCAPVKEGNIKENTIMGKLRKSSELNKIRMYQGYSDLDADSERKRGDILKDPEFAHLYLNTKAKIAQHNIEVRANTSTYVDGRNNNRRFTTDEAKAMTTTMWSSPFADKIIVRTATMYTLLNGTAMRGIEIRDVRDAQFGIRVLDSVGPAKCVVIAMVFTAAKTANSFAHCEITRGITRSKNRDKCPVGFLSAYKVYKEDLSESRGVSVLRSIEEYADDTIEWMKGGCEGDKPTRKWHTFKLFHKDKQPSVGISYGVHNSDVKTLMQTANIEGKHATTYMPRVNETCIMLEAGANIRDIETAGGWGHETEAQMTYLKGALSPKVLLHLAGWSGKDGGAPGLNDFWCSWQSPSSFIPKELKTLVFPRLDIIGSKMVTIKNFSLKYPNVVAASDWNVEMNTLDTYDYYRTVYIQDATVLQSAHPLWPTYKGHSLFTHPLWPSYVIEERLRVAQTEQKFFDESPEGIAAARHQEVVQRLSGKKRKATEATARTDEYLDALVSRTMDSSTNASLFGSKPNVIEPDNILMGYKDWKENWSGDDGPLEWNAWFGKEQANKQRYFKTHDTYIYMDKAAACLTPEIIADKLTEIARDLNVSPRDFVKNCMYFYFRPPSETAKAKSKCTREQLESAIAAAGLPSL